tara:strand:+ start:4776 stop:5732 length:957 start_codon:yes stop_codon:yes gene_type:complete
MTHDNLIAKIKDIYKKSIADLNAREANSEVESLISIINSAKKKALASKAFEQISEPVSEEVKDGLSSLEELLASELSTTTSLRDEVLLELADEYIGEVEEFSQSGGKGFYDAAIRIAVKFDSHAEDVEKHMQGLQNKGFNGLDIQLVDKDFRGNPTYSDNGCSTILTYIYPTSIMDELKEEVAEFTKKFDIVYSNFFIAPSLTNDNSHCDDAIQFFKDTKETFDATDTIGDTVLDALTSMGLFRVDFSWINEFEPITPVKKALENPYIYQDIKDHVNGMMPTRECYSFEECKKIGLAVHPDDLVTRNMEHEVRLFERS